MAGCTGKWLVVVVVCLSGIRPAESMKCTVHLLENGSAQYDISGPAKPDWVADWAINDKNIANDKEFNRSLVVQNTGNSLLLKAYHPNTTYIADKTKWPVKVSCDGPASSNLIPHDANKQSRGAILDDGVIALLVIALLVILTVIGFCWQKKKGLPCRRFRKTKQEQGDPEASVQLKGNSITIEKE